MKLYKYKNETEPVVYYGTGKQVEIPGKYSEKPFRAMWVSNVVNIDMPTTEDPEKYKAAVIRMLDTCVEFNLNAVIFHVRTTNDAFYASKLNPYSRYLTGEEGKEPPFDAMNFVISEARRRNLEFHAWCNPYRVSMQSQLDMEDYLKACDDLNFAKRHPEHLLLDTKGQIIMNPAREAVKQFIVDSMVEIAENYDIDAIHWDDYFYPYAGLDPAADDSADYAARDDETQTLGDFRRMHVTDVIDRVHKAIKNVDKNLRFGVSPFGIWRNRVNDEKGSNTDPKCSESYDNQYADSYRWVKAGMVDYIVPQIYWEFGHPIAPFADILKFWVDVCEDSPVDLYIGHAAYRQGQEGEFENPREVVNQLKFTNAHDTVKGNVFFTFKTFVDEGAPKPGLSNIKKLLTKGEIK